MDYSIFKFGALYLDDKIQPVPQQPEIDGDIPQYDGKASISLGTLASEGINWIKPIDSNLLVADRVLLTKVSWEDLDKDGLVAGKTVLLNGQHFRCRLLQVGDEEGVPNEWDKVLHKTVGDNSLWHWENIFFWGADISAYNMSNRAVRGYYSARYWYHDGATDRSVDVGFRPALEPLPSDTPTTDINLDGVDFQLSSLPGGEGFCPILQPARGNVFKDIPVGRKVRMYTFLEGGKPIHVGATVKDISKLTLADSYYGDEYLVPWVISNGIAIASQSFPKKSQ